MDEAGTPVLGDQLLVLFGRDLVHRMGKGHAVIFDVKSSEVLGQELKRAGLAPTMWKTGHSLIKQKMKELHFEQRQHLLGVGRFDRGTQRFEIPEPHEFADRLGEQVVPHDHGDLV